MTTDTMLEAIAYDTRLDFPLHHKDDLVGAMTLRATVDFQGKLYDAGRGAELLPDFFFPIDSPDDFLTKVGELLIARGLAPWPSARVRTAPDQSVPTEPLESHLAEVIARIRVALCSPARDGLLPPDCVDAVDIVAHGLDFAGHPDGLSLWREALWGQRLVPEAVVAIEVLGEHVTAAAQRGEWAAITAICDCLDELLEPSLLATHHVGGIGRFQEPVTTDQQEGRDELRLHT